MPKKRAYYSGDLTILVSMELEYSNEHEKAYRPVTIMGPDGEEHTCFPIVGWKDDPIVAARMALGDYDYEDYDAWIPENSCVTETYKKWATREWLERWSPR